MQPPRVIMHVDMDAFFASVEQRDNPQLLGKPVIVGGSPDGRGVVCAASYEARPFGVRSALPCAQAKKLCPEGIFVRPRHERYHEASRQVRDVMDSTGALVEPMSIDEAYLDMTESILGRLEQTSSQTRFEAAARNMVVRNRHFLTQRRAWAALEPARRIELQDAILLVALPLARELKAAIRTLTNLTGSIGLASNKMLAKLGSGFNKPDGLTLIPERDKARFLRGLPLRAIHGVGPATAETLRAAAIETVAHLQDFNGNLQAVVGSWGASLLNYSYGIDSRPVQPSSQRKSISCEETFEHDTSDRPFLRKILRTQASEIAETLRNQELEASTITVKVRYGDFSTRTRQLRLHTSVADADSIYRTACKLLARHQLVSRPLRLLGVGVSGLRPPNQQLELCLPTISSR